MTPADDDALPPQVLDNLRNVASEQDAVQAGTFDKYRLIREIARGAMGVVYEAEDVELHRVVALKVMRDAAGLSDVMRQRFRREALSAGRLSHPNVVQVHDAGEAGGKPYLVMEFVDGQPLSVILGQRHYEVPAMLRLLEKVARGVAAAHEAGIVHRDVKPANILVTSGGEPKVGDFGLAHWMDSDSALTKTGAPMGTPMYMAPEQVRGGRGDVSAATDVYALGAILYEILTGRPPHTGESTVEIYDRILNDEPVAPRRFGTRVPMDLQTICLKALDKSPARRYANAKDFADDLRRQLDGEPVLARPAGPVIRVVRWVRRHRGVAVAIAIVAVAALSLLAGEYRARRQRAAEIAAALQRSRAALENHARAVAAGRGLQDRYDEVITSLAALLVLDPANLEGRGLLAAFHFAAYERAAAAEDAERMRAEALQVKIYDDPRAFVPKLAREGTLCLDSTPPGAEAELFRYVEAPDHRLVAEKDRALGKCPIAQVVLPAGSYVVVLKLPGRRDVRYPVVIRHKTATSGAVSLHADERIGKEYIQVGAGSFTRGGDPDAPDPKPATVVDLPEFFIGRVEVTIGEYLEFINDLIERDGVEVARQRLVRDGAGPRWKLPAGSRSIIAGDPESLVYPVNGISPEDAEAFAVWKTEKARAAGERVRYRLPSAAEWEKAARGPDRRCFPWGNVFDPTFVAQPDPSTGRSVDRPAGAHPKDESPYGVLDLAGSLSEFCSDPDASGSACAVKGGNNVFTWAATFRSSHQTWMSLTATLRSVGFRLVRVVEP